jgi:hypothetical protein
VINSVKFTCSYSLARWDWRQVVTVGPCWLNKQPVLRLHSVLVLQWFQRSLNLVTSFVRSFCLSCDPLPKQQNRSFSCELLRSRIADFENVRLRSKGQCGLKGFWSCPSDRPWRPIGLWDVEAPTFSRQSAQRWRWSFPPYAPAALPPGRFLVLISVIGWVDPRGVVRLVGLGQLKNPMTSSGIEPTTFRLIA